MNKSKKYYLNLSFRFSPLLKSFIEAPPLEIENLSIFLILKIKLLTSFFLRRLQFLYSDWRQSTLFPDEKNDIEIPEFLQREANAEIKRVFAKGINKVRLAEIDELIQKYGIQNPLLREKMKPLINLDDSFHGTNN